MNNKDILLWHIESINTPWIINGFLILMCIVAFPVLINIQSSNAVTDNMLYIMMPAVIIFAGFLSLQYFSKIYLLEKGYRLKQ